MKIKVTKEVKIDFPVWYIWGTAYHQINSERSYVVVEMDEKEWGIKVRKPNITGFVEAIIDEGVECSKQDFENAFEKIFDRLNAEYAKVSPTHRFNQEPEEENGLSESERNEDRINEYHELEQQSQEL